MKKIMMLVVLAAITLTTMAQKDVIKLPQPNMTGGKPFYEVMNARQTQRQFSDKELTDQMLSDLLWCANGINRPDGKRTAPSARNCKEIDIYVFNKKGVYFYDPVANTLNLVFGTDARHKVSKQCEFAAKAPVILVFFANYGKMPGFDKEAREFYGATDCGYVSQNVYLYCAEKNLATVVMGAIDRESLSSIIPSRDGKVILAQPVGFPEK
ncbi:MAG: nitroreductase family protein [Bacteroidales bacterium]|nr:nitroreductase family protein [Bacteroidales bacterium]